MKSDQLKGNWDQIKGKVKEEWGKLTDDDLLEIAGRREQLAGKIRERYAVAQEEAERKIREWEERVDLPSTGSET